MKTLTTTEGYKLSRILWFYSGVFLLTNEKSNILIDTGPGFMWRVLRKRLDKLNLRKIDLLILTHSHFDHTGNAARIAERYAATTLIHRNEARYLTKGESYPPVGLNPWSRFVVKTFLNRPGGMDNYPPCRADITPDDEFSLSDYGFNAYLMHTPGHTPGSVSVIIDNEVAVVADAMSGLFPGSILPPFASDTKLMVKSWGKLLETGCRLFIPAHGSAIKRAKAERCYRKVLAKEQA